MTENLEIARFVVFFEVGDQATGPEVERFGPVGAPTPSCSASLSTYRYALAHKSPNDLEAFLGRPPAQGL